LVASTSNQSAANQSAADEKRGATKKEIHVDPSEVDKKLRVNMVLEAK
jgi:hypothetical protein